MGKMKVLGPSRGSKIALIHEGPLAATAVWGVRFMFACWIAIDSRRESTELCIYRTTAIVIRTERARILSDEHRFRFLASHPFSSPISSSLCDLLLEFGTCVD